MCCARSAAVSSASARCDRPVVALSCRISRMRLPMSVPPVSRVSTASSVSRQQRGLGALAAALGALEGDVAAGRRHRSAPYPPLSVAGFWSTAGDRTMLIVRFESQIMRQHSRPTMWIPITISAAVFQTARTATQQRLRSLLSVSGAGFVRYLYGAPFAIARGDPGRRGRGRHPHAAGTLLADHRRWWSGPDPGHRAA